MKKQVVHVSRSRMTVSGKLLSKLDETHGDRFSRSFTADPDGFRQRLAFSLAFDLSTNEMSVMVVRYGVLDGQYKALAGTSVVIGVSRERVRQIEGKALNKLRTSLIKREAAHEG